MLIAFVLFAPAEAVLSHLRRQPSQLTPRRPPGLRQASTGIVHADKDCSTGIVARWARIRLVGYRCSVLVDG